jgi:DNA-binding NarL/FixJ family response regulator
MKLRHEQTDRIPVWVVDDIRSYCEVLSEALNRGKSIDCQKYYLSCRSAVQALMVEKNPPTVILLDIMMPRLSGMDAIPMFKSASPSTHIIMLTSHDLDENVRTAMNRGADGYLLKTSSPAEITDAIGKVARGEMPIDATIVNRIIESFLSQSRGENSHNLTRREKEVLRYAAAGLTVQEMAQKLKISYFTVDTHLKNIHQKLNVHNRHGLVAKASKEGLV